MPVRALLAVVLGAAVWHSLSPLARDITRLLPSSHPSRRLHGSTKEQRP
jgi:hypothetical protein